MLVMTKFKDSQLAAFTIKMISINRKKYSLNLKNLNLYSKILEDKSKRPLYQKESTLKISSNPHLKKLKVIHSVEKLYLSFKIIFTKYLKK